MHSSDLRAIEKNMIADDAGFMVGLFIATRLLPGTAPIPYLFSCIDFYSLVVHEAYNYYVRHDPALAKRFKQRYPDDIKQSRQRIKLYDDNKLGIEGIGRTLLDTITPAHQKELSKTHRIKLPDWMWSDVSLYFIEDNPIPVCSTHLASFNMGIDVIRMFDKSTATEFGEDLGHFLIAICDKVMLVRLPQLNIISRDMRSEKLYTEERYGSSSKVINAGLSIIDMNLNFAALCLPPSKQQNTLFKWKFLMAYHAISSLKKLCSDPNADDIRTNVLSRVKSVLNSQVATLMQSEGASVLRNTLTHYGIDSRLDTSRLSLDSRQFYGLVEAAFPDWQYKDLAAWLDGQIQHEMLNIFHAWD